MAEETKRTHTPKEGKREEGSSRRNFLKKAAYAAPSLIVLGQLGRPNRAKGAEIEQMGFGNPPSDPG